MYHNLRISLSTGTITEFKINLNCHYSSIISSRDNQFVYTDDERHNPFIFYHLITTLEDEWFFRRFLFILQKSIVIKKVYV